MKQYALDFAEGIERQLDRCRVSLREAIRTKLQEVVAIATLRPSRRRAAPPAGPPLRFYVTEGYRVFYEVNPITRIVTVLELRAESS